MKLPLLHKILSFSIIEKAATYKKGSLVILSAPISYGTLKPLEILLKNTDPYNFILPIVTMIGCVFLYLVVWFIDFLCGLVASKHEANGEPNWVKSEKLYSSLGKLGGVLLIDFILLLFTLFLALVNFSDTSFWVLFLTVLLNILAMCYELHSINENIFRRTGKKVRYLSFFEKVTGKIEESIINKISNKLG